MLVGFQLIANGSTHPKTRHVDFGLVLGEDQKRFWTGSSEVVWLVNLLDEEESQ